MPELRWKDPVTKRVIGEALDNESKARTFYKLFFPAKPLVSSVPEDAVYPEPKWQYEWISDDQITRAIAAMRPQKASRPGTVTNMILKFAGETLVPHLGHLFRATDDLNWYPDQWKVTQTPVIKKPGKTDYTVPNAWRPVVLSDGLARLLNKCKANELTEKCEKHGILHQNHFGGRPSRATVDSLHILVKSIKDAWRKGLVASVLFLDVKGAFPSVDIDRMMHEMKVVGIPEGHIQWMRRRLDNRKTTLTFDDFRSQEFSIDNGLDQGDPISGTSYMLYNGGLLGCLDHKAGEFGGLFIDDAFVMAVGRDLGETHRKIKDVMERDRGVFEWADTHNCEFGLDKFQLVDFTRRREPDPERRGKTRPLTRTALELREHIIPSKSSAKFLGVLIDRELRWTEQSMQMVAKGQTWAAQIQRIAKTKTGVPPSLVRRLYIAVAVPRIFYAADICVVAGSRKNLIGSAKLNTRLKTIQCKAAIAITGALRSTASDVLDVHANLLPIPLLIQKVRARAALRLATLPESHPIHKHVRQAAKRRVKRHPAPLHGLMHDFSIEPDLLEKVDPAANDKAWKPGFTVKIAKTKGLAAVMDLEDSASIQIYTDGSGAEGHIGAAAVLYRNGQKVRSLRYYLGTDKEHTVPEAEGVALILGLELLKGETGVRRVSMAADNIGAVTRSDDQRVAPMQYLWRMFRRQWERTARCYRNIRLTIRWVPGHLGIRGNEEADRLAKLAVGKGSSKADRLPAGLKKPLPIARNAVARRINEAIKKKAQLTWKKSQRFQRMREIDGTMPSGKFLEVVEELPRHQASLLIQLRTGHVPLRAYLYRIQKEDSPVCEYCGRE